MFEKRTLFKQKGSYKVENFWFLWRLSQAIMVFCGDTRVKRVLAKADV